jgi:hypothetical protein
MNELLHAARLANEPRSEDVVAGKASPFADRTSPERPITARLTRSRPGSRRSPEAGLPRTPAEPAHYLCSAAG